MTETERLRQLAAACRKQAQIASNAETAAALECMADKYEAEVLASLTRSKPVRTRPLSATGLPETMKRI